jgi:hypothetical protein
LNHVRKKNNVLSGYFEHDFASDIESSSSYVKLNFFQEQCDSIFKEEYIVNTNDGVDILQAGSLQKKMNTSSYGLGKKQDAVYKNMQFISASKTVC